MMLNTLSGTYWLFEYFLVEYFLVNVCSNPLLIFYGVVCLFSIGLYEFFTYSRIKSVFFFFKSDLRVTNVFSQSVGCLLIFSTVSVDKQKCKILTLFNNWFFL